MPGYYKYEEQWAEALRSDMNSLRSRGLYRTPRIISERDSVNIVVDGKRLINFSSNDYLGFACHPRIREAINDAGSRFGVGSSASPMICGKTALHQELETRLAAVTGRDRAAIFSCGYMANLGMVQGLVKAVRPHVIMDKLCHASIIDGVILSGASYSRYKHASMESLCTRLEAAGRQKKLVLTESVFSMDGDIAPLNELSDICRKQGAWLIVDDAHGFGVLGENGLGGLEQAGLGQQEVPLMMATFGKALGVQGAFIAGRADLVEAVLQRARPYIYSTSMPISDVAGVIVALDLLHEEPHRREHLKTIISHYQDSLPAAAVAPRHQLTPINPLIIGDMDRTMKVSQLLEQQGIYVTAIRPPTVPDGTSRLRITLTADHTHGQVTQLVGAINVSLEQTSHLNRATLRDRP